MKINNPFILSGYISPEYFCDRQNETKRIISALKNGRNITLFSIRRIGKTGLIHHVINEMVSEEKIHFFYVDILPTTDFSSFINLFASQLLGKLDSKPERIIKRISEIFSGLRPTISFDPYTGAPSLQVEIKTTAEADITLQKIFNYLKSTKKRIIIAIDEFQQITNYPEKNIEAAFRSNIQGTPGINFIFSGSQQHILLSIFNEYGKPFYQSTEMMQLGRIDKKEYSEFICSKFENSKKKIPETTINYILDACNLHTYFVQYLCNRLYELKDTIISEKMVAKILRNILKENEPVYINYRNLLTKYQWKVLSAIASESNLKSVTSKDFISKYNLGTPSSVHTAVKSLVQKEMIYTENDEYLIYDVFLGRWLGSELK